LANPIQTISLKVEDETSGVIRYMIRVDNDEPYEFIDTEEKGLINLKPIAPGYHSVIIEAFDRAGNSIIQNFSFTTTAFSKPEFTEYPNEINEDVIPVIRGNTRPNATVELTVTRIGAEPTIYNLVADENGVFTLIPEGTFSTGVYELVAQATDEFGAISELSNPIRIAVQQPGFIRVGSMIVSVLSVIIPLAAMVILLVVASWFLLLYFRRFKRRVSVESSEVATILDREFNTLYETLVTQRAVLTESRKAKKLTKAEEDLFAILDNSLKQAQKKVEKEVADVEKLVQKKE
jgi:5-hydroxyisourate hydrolase-like protein (transthyretin family)